MSVINHVTELSAFSNIFLKSLNIERSCLDLNPMYKNRVIDKGTIDS